MTRADIINHLSSVYGYQNYLEIGARDLNHCFNWVQCPNKTSVDPKLETDFDYTQYQYDYELTSDDFFIRLDASELNIRPDKKWDIIFIDGLHLAEQVDRDMQNSLNHLADGGTIVMHDCKPPDAGCAREDFYSKINANGTPFEWTGTTWKAFYKWYTSRSDLQMWTVDTDWGVGIIRRGSRLLPRKTNPFYEFNTLQKNIEHDLNLISIEHFLEIFQ